MARRQDGGARRDRPGALDVASIQKRNTSAGTAYRVRWRDPSGREVSRQFPTLARARAHKAIVETELLRGSYVDPKRGKVTLGEYATEWLAIQTYGPTTRERRELSVRLHILPTIGRHPLSALRPPVIQAWLRGLSDHLAPRTVRELFRLLSSILGAAVEDERITKNPCKSPSLRVPRPDEKPLVPWTPEQILALRLALPERYRILLTIITGLGLRQGEAFGLAVDDIDLVREVVTVRRQVAQVGGRLMFALPKGRKVRAVPLPGSVAEELASYLQLYPPVDVALPSGHPDGRHESARLIVTSREGKALNRNHVNPYVWKPALRRAGLPDTREFGFDGGRHFYASLQLESGVGPRALADYLGHADPAFTLKIYAHLMPEAHGKAQAAVDRLFLHLGGASTST